MNVHSLGRAMVGILAALFPIGGLRAADTPAAAPEKVNVVAAPRYRAGPIHKFLLGPTYRRLWITPVAVEVLDLSRFGGGLKPVKKGGGAGKTTRSLRFESKDGREWRGRAVDKDAVGGFPPELRATFDDDLATEQVSAAHPAGPRRG